jgi:sec-independent protein translocase protein TatC
MPLGDHLDELRKRLILVIAGLLPFLVVALTISRGALEFMIRPVRGALRDAGLPPLIQSTGPAEVFGSYVKVAVILTVLGGSWWVLTQAWLFVRPGLYRRERRFVYVLIPLSVSLTVAGVMFMYAVMLPVVLGFFITFGASLGVPDYNPDPAASSIVLPQAPVLAGDPPDPAVGQYWVNKDLRELRICLSDPADGAPEIRGVPLTSGSGILQLYRLSEYVNLILMLALGFAVGFQMPVVVLLLGWAGIVEPRDLVGIRKLMLMGCLIVAAILTPADPVSMLLLGIPLYLLYEFGLILLRLMPADRLGGGEPADADA